MEFRSDYSGQTSLAALFLWPPMISKWEGGSPNRYSQKPHKGPLRALSNDGQKADLETRNPSAGAIYYLVVPAKPIKHLDFEVECGGLGKNRKDCPRTLRKAGKT